MKQIDVKLQNGRTLTIHDDNNQVVITCSNKNGKGISIAKLEDLGKAMKITSLIKKGWNMPTNGSTGTTSTIPVKSATYKEITDVLKVGDKVRVKNDLVLNQLYKDVTLPVSEIFVPYMTPYLGLVGTIEEVDDTLGYTIRFKNDKANGTAWFWTSSMLELQVIKTKNI